MGGVWRRNIVAEMKCPGCKLENPPEALRCDCGYDFHSGTTKTPYLTPKAGHMHLGRGHVRIRMILLFFALCYATLYFYTDDPHSFCSELGVQGHVVSTVRLALACSIWELAVGILGSLGAKKYLRWPGFAPIVSSIAGGLGFVSIPLWIYRGFDKGFLFQNTWADVSCFFTEGYGFGFLYVAAPILALETLLCEWLITVENRPA